MELAGWCIFAFRWCHISYDKTIVEVSRVLNPSPGSKDIGDLRQAFRFAVSNHPTFLKV